MKFSEIIEVNKQVLESLTANMLRSILSALGVVIGISFVILMGYAISGLDLTLETTFNIIGQDMLYVDKFDWAGGKRWKDLRQRKNITLEQSEELCKRLKSAELGVPIARQWATKVKYLNENYEGINIQGTKSEYSQTPAGETEEGRFFSPFEDRNIANVVVLGYKVYNTIFPKGGGVGKTIKIDGNKYLIIGKIKKQGVLFIDFVDEMVFMPLNSFVAQFGKHNRSMSVAVKAGSEENLDEVRAEIKGTMRILRNLSPSEEDDFSINESRIFKSSVESLRLYIWGIGIGLTALSFIVGIIGIMNIMFVSVAERTREIGIRKAIGAKRISILIQFIFEAMYLCLIGAIISFILCSILIWAAISLLIYFVPELEFLPKIIPANLFIIASLVSLIVGVLAGLMPAMRAAKLDPVDALRFE